eukprot:gnl/TRDRNA2_/TRDRNA2_168288_c2_seq1.p1 gnl/TRDRNA2_/TRDRNA2_168288_c2~~gnl/TRDRNA2_/TRDRNA2_168288_c2_seq1.p1  ORF type:complete len:575 (-),score=85.34 gnl/TRDRNA2_/TRDRNA2_168288_c2_seq1:40-1635(-)
MSAAAKPPSLGATEAGGWYVSAVIRNMLREGCQIAGLQLRPKEDFISLGTPQQLQSFLVKLRNGEVRLRGSRSMRFVFDLDGTLVTPPKRHGDYTSVEPIAQNIELVRSLKAAGHYIVIWTSRESERLQGNTGAIVAAVGLVTISTLQQLDIPYDELLFGKPHANAYIDHRAINSMMHTEKELGWAATQKDELMAGSVAARAFNTVRPLDDRHVVKTGPCHVMRGEIFWYRQVPPNLEDLFPKAIEISEGSHMSSVVMTKVEGVPFTHLLMNLCLTPSRLLKLLSSLTRLHRCAQQRRRGRSTTDTSITSGKIPEDPAGEANAENEDKEEWEETEAVKLPDATLYTNYKPKLLERFEKHRALYQSFPVSQLGFNAEELVQPLANALQAYQDNGRACQAAYIHGDPVFSNVLLAKQGGIWLLDMRGALGDTLTTSGDVVYDLAKVYQSLCGYDFYLQDREVTQQAQELLDTLQRVFWSYVATYYPEVSASDIRLITAEHYFTMVPLHEVRSRMCLYLRASHRLLVQEGLITS